MDLLCHLPVVPLRADASDRAEMVSQVLYGETMLLLDKQEKWSMVRLTHDHYEGWIDNKQYVAMDAIPAERGMVTSPFSGGPVPLPAGSLLRGNTDRENGAEAGAAADPAAIAGIAQRFLGAPYLWGGRTAMGIDCSGFTQLVFRLTGRALLRDASQQVTQGQAVTFMEEAVTGDLAFFDNAEGRITHVGILLKEGASMRIIHASGEVRIDPIDHQGIFHAATGTYSHSLRTIRRL